MSDTEKKGNENDQTVEACGGEKGRSQHERQNVKEYKKQSHTMTQTEQEQAIKQEQMSQDTLMQELLAAENNFRLKLQVVEEQVAEQHEHILQLRINQADMAQIAREQLVKQHLLKRQAKLRAMLSKMLDNKAKLQYTLSRGREGNTPVYAGCNTSVEDKFSQFKQGKNYHSWQLNNVLKTEEKDQHKGRSDSTITDDDFLSVLTEDERTACAKIMESFMQGTIADPVDAGICDQRLFRECLKLLKQQYLHTLVQNTQMQMAQQLQPQFRQAVDDHPSEFSHQLQPSNPHQDSGDHNMSDATQTDSSVLFSQQRPAVGCTSVLHIPAAPEAVLSLEDSAMSMSDAEKKGNENDQTVEACGGEKGRSQHKRQNVKEYKKHSHKMTQTEQKQAIKQEQISQDILMQELLAAEKNLRLKLQVVEVQLAEQHEHILQLRINHVGKAQIAREQLVKQHLLKRQAKLCAMLSTMLDNKAKL